MKTTSITAQIFASILLLWGAASCSKSVAGDARGAGQEPTATATAATPAAEVSDLDRPVDELLSMTCEHKRKTFECDECRYETGVVRAPADLFSEGLLDTVKAVRQRIELPLRLTGEVQFDERRVMHLSMQAEGSIRSVRVALGDRVQQGQALIEIESMAVGEAEGGLLEARAVLQLAQRNFDRVAELRKESIASEKEYLQSAQELETARIRTESALGVLTRLGMSPSDVRALDPTSARGRLVLRTPSSGTVLALHAVPGEVARTEESLATIGDNSTIWVWADLYERDLAVVTREQARRKLTATVTVRAYPGEEFPGIVDLVSPSMDQASRTVRLRVEVKNPTRRLFAGMFAEVKLSLPGREEALTLPRSAVLEDEGRSFVFTYHHGEYYVRRPVELGSTWGEQVEIVRGLKAGQTVVADGAFLMKSDVLRSKMGAGCAD